MSAVLGAPRRLPVSRGSAPRKPGVFRKHLRESPRRWRIRERLIAAQSLIRENALIAGVAEACGFCDVYHFGREFKRVVGTSPAAWRRAEFGAR